MQKGEAYERKLEQAEVTVTCVRYNGTIHDFGLKRNFSLTALWTLFSHQHPV